MATVFELICEQNKKIEELKNGIVEKQLNEKN